MSFSGDRVLVLQDGKSFWKWVAKQCEPYVTLPNRMLLHGEFYVMYILPQVEKEKSVETLRKPGQVIYRWQRKYQIAERKQGVGSCSQITSSSGELLTLCPTKPDSCPRRPALNADCISKKLSRALALYLFIYCLLQTHLFSFSFRSGKPAKP